MNRISTLAFAAVLTLPVTAHAITVTAINGGVFVGAYAEANAVAPPISDFQTGSDSWVSVPATVFTSAQATAADREEDGGGTITSYGSAYAVWTSATSGTVELHNFGYVYDGSMGGTAALNFGENWSYTFTPSTNGVYSMKYNVVGQGYALWGFYNSVDGVIDYSTTLDPHDPSASGTFTANLVGGQTYHVALGNLTFVQSAELSGSMDGDFEWSITGASVPEPTSWAMLIAGFGMVGTVARRRRSNLASA